MALLWNPNSPFTSDPNLQPAAPMVQPLPPPPVAQRPPPPRPGARPVHVTPTTSTNNAAQRSAAVVNATQKRIEEGDTRSGPKPGAGVRTLTAVGQAHAVATQKLYQLPATVANAAAMAQDYGAQKMSDYMSPWLQAMRERARASQAQGSMSFSDLIGLMDQLWGGATAAASYAGDEVSVLFGKLKEVKERVGAVEIKADEIPRVAGRLADVTAALERQGLFDQGSFQKNFQNGQIWINGKPFNAKAFLLSLVTLRSAIAIDELKDTTAFMDRLTADVKASEFYRPVQSVGINPGTGLVVTEFDPSTMSHVFAPDPLDPTDDASVFLDIATDDSLSLQEGDPFPAVFAGRMIFYKHNIRLTHDRNGLLTVLATAGVQQLQSAIAQAVPTFSNSISGLLKIATGADYVTGT